MLIADHITSALRATADGDLDARWEHVCALHRDGSVDALHAALRLCNSAAPTERELGADILGQLGGSGPTSPHRAHSAPVLLGLLHDLSEDVVSAALVSIGHLHIDVEAAVLVALSSHASKDVRYALAVALPSSGGAVSSSLLIALMNDTDEEVRNWATFGLGSQREVDSPLIRDALLARTSDAHAETRGEAIAGLAIRQDPRVLEPLLRDLRASTVGRLTVEAARDLASSELLPDLQALVPWWDVDQKLLAEAIAACSPMQ